MLKFWIMKKKVITKMSKVYNAMERPERSFCFRIRFLVDAKGTQKTKINGLVWLFMLLMWPNVKETLPTETSISMETGDLTLGSVRIEDEGPYLCQKSFSDSTRDRLRQLNVNGKTFDFARM